MIKTILLLVIMGSSFYASSQFLAKMEIKEVIPGICNTSEVYALFPNFKGQEEAICPVSKNEILKKLNSEVVYIKNYPNYSDKGMIGLIINCKGELVQCKMDNKTKSAELDTQIEAVFKLLGSWKAGKLNGKEVDTSKLYSFKIKNGKFSFD